MYKQIIITKVLIFFSRTKVHIVVLRWIPVKFHSNHSSEFWKYVLQQYIHFHQFDVGHDQLHDPCVCPHMSSYTIFLLHLELKRILKTVCSHHWSYRILTVNVSVLVRLTFWLHCFNHYNDQLQVTNCCSLHKITLKKESRLYNSINSFSTLVSMHRTPCFLMKYIDRF